MTPYRILFLSFHLAWLRIGVGVFAIILLRFECRLICHRCHRHRHFFVCAHRFLHWFFFFRKKKTTTNGKINQNVNVSVSFESWRLCMNTKSYETPHSTQCDAQNGTSFAWLPLCSVAAHDCKMLPVFVEHFPWMVMLIVYFRSSFFAMVMV